MTKRRLGELLQAEGLITEDQVRAALELQRKEGMFLGEALVKLGFVSEEAIAHTIVQQFSLPFVSAQQFSIPTDVLTIYPERMYYEYQFIAVDKMGRVLLIVGAGLMNHDVLDELERLSGCKVCQYVSTWKDIKSALDKYSKDLRKESELSSLGSMLLDDLGSAPPSPAPAAMAKPASTVAPMPAAAASAAKPAGSPSFLKPAAATATPAAGIRPASVAAKAPLTAAPSVAAKGPPTQSVPKAVPGNAGSQRLSAMAAQKPGATAAPNAAAAGEHKENPPPKSGLLGLFKKS